MNATERLTAALADRHRVERELGRGGHGHGISGRGSSPSPPARVALGKLLAQKPRFLEDAREELAKWFGEWDLLDRLLEGMRKAEEASRT